MWRWPGVPAPIDHVTGRGSGVWKAAGPLRDRIRSAIDALAGDPRPAGVVELAGRDDYGVRVSDYRIVHAVDDAEHVVLGARIAHQREVYRR